mgnify:CR=1 FL=1
MLCYVKDLSANLSMTKTDNIQTIKIYQYMTAERVLFPHLIAIDILKNYKQDTLMLCLGSEGWDISYNGTERIVKEICDRAKIPYDKIIFRTANLNQTLTYFKSKPYPFNLDFAMLEYHKEAEPCFNKKYGIFLGRPDNLRLYAFYKHLTWSCSSQGIATFHYDPKNINEYESDFTNFLIDHNTKWHYIKDQLPYSDLNNYIKIPIVNESHKEINFWKDLYSKISIEIICETNVHNESFFITEKTLRPILYKKLFVIIGSKNYEQQLKEMGFDIFDDIIDKTYDKKQYSDRIEHLYSSLEHILRVLSESNELKVRLENNQKLAATLISEHKNKRKEWLS